MSGELTMRPTRREVLKATSIVMGVPIEEILGESRYRSIVQARHVYCFVARECGYSLSQVGKEIRRDHTTSHNSVHRMESMMAADASWQNVLDNVRAIARGDSEVRQRFEREAAERVREQVLAEEDARKLRQFAALVDTNDHAGLEEIRFMSSLASTNARFVEALRRHHPEMEVRDFGRPVPRVIVARRQEEAAA